jgi:transaldolase
MATIRELNLLGQSIWYDYIRRSFITSGELESLIAEGLSGITSNPAIFEKAIAESSDYDDEIRRMAETDSSVKEIYEALAIEDISHAADLFLPVYRATEGKDGYVSIEVSPELAYDTVQTVLEAKRLYARIQRPNVMIKVPGTKAGIPAITGLIGAGININVTLLFSIDNYKEVADAYLKGLENLSLSGPAVDGGHPVNRVASVASFFVSRVDTAVDAELEKKGNKELQGHIAIANARIVAREFKDIYAGGRWKKLSTQEARVQRLLWASTGTKNPSYPDTMYVDNLIGPGTVNTVPPATLKSFIDHGTVSETLTGGIEEAEAQLNKLTEIGIDLDTITVKLQEEGVAAFASPFRSLMNNIAEKRERFLSAGRKLPIG